MADVLSIQDTVYAGEAETGFFLTRPVVEMDTFQKGCINVKDGIRKQHTIDRLEVSNFIQDRQAVPTSAGSIVIDYKQLIPNYFNIYMEFNPNSFTQNWFAIELQEALLNRGLPPTAENFILYQLLKRTNQYTEYAIWQSRLAYNPNLASPQTVPAALTAATLNNNFYYFDGLIEKALQDVNTITIAGAVALTYTNIRAQFEAAIEAVPQALLNKYGKMGLRFLVSYKDQLKYSRALREDTFKNENTTESSVEKWAGYDVTPLAGLPENVFFLCLANPDPQSGNAWMGINSKEDAKVELRPLQNNAELWFVKGMMSADVNWAFTDQLVMYNGAGLTA